MASVINIKVPECVYFCTSVFCLSSRQVWVGGGRGQQRATRRGRAGRRAAGSWERVNPGKVTPAGGGFLALSIQEFRSCLKSNVTEEKSLYQSIWQSCSRGLTAGVGTNHFLVTGQSFSILERSFLPPIPPTAYTTPLGWSWGWWCLK